MNNFFSALWTITAESALWLLVGFAIAGVIHALVPRAWLAKSLGKPGVRSVSLASLVGIPMPLCSCSVIPTAAALHRSGASKGASAAFAISTPEIDVPSTSLTLALIGWPMAVARVLAAAVTSLLTGVLIDRFTGRAPTPATKPDADQPAPEPSCCNSQSATTSGPKTVPLPAASCCSSGANDPEPEPAAVPLAVSPCCSSTPPKPQAPAESCCSSGGSAPPEANPGETPLRSKLAQALRFAAVDLPRDLALWLALGLLLAALASDALPDSFLENNIPAGLTAMLLMLVVGVPFYVCAVASTPLAAALIAKGLSPGAALVFLLAGPATNPATIAWIAKDLGKRAMTIYLACIATCSLVAGLALDALLAAAILPLMSVVVEHAHEHLGPVDHAAGVVLGLLLIVALVRRFVPGRSAHPSTISVPTPASV